MIIVNKKPDNKIAISDRGLQYGDGVFETIAYRNAKAEFLEAHLSRLNLACKCLKIPFQQQAQLQQELIVVFKELADNNAVIKIIITRGSSGRGYFADNSIEPTRIISTHPLPLYPVDHAKKGISARFCQHRLSENSNLAGIKHLNRLEQVLARNEWNDPAIAEGIMLDQHDRIIEGTMSNLFIVKSAKLFTAQLNSSGVAGIIRAQIIAFANDNNIDCEETTLTKSALADADEVFVCNSIIGIWPVISIIDNKINYNYSLGKITVQLQDLLFETFA